MALKETTLLASTVQGSAGSGSGSLVDTAVGAFDGSTGDARFYLKVTAISGTSPSLVITLKTTVNGVTVVLAVFTAVTAVGEANLFVPACPPNVQATWALAGTGPSATFELYCSRA